MTDSVLSALDFTFEDKIIAIRENNTADASFILASIMSKCLSNENNVCLITLHNTVGHYQNIGRRLGYDLLKKITENCVKTIDPLKDIVDDFSRTEDNKKYLSPDPVNIAKQLFLEINEATQQLLKNGKNTYVILDDLSHLVDLGLDLKHISNFIQHLIGLTINKNVSIVVNCHVGSIIDDLITNILFHSADLCITVSALKTGRSRNVSGVMIVNRNEENTSSVCRQSVYHYKLLEKEIRTFAPGWAII